MTPEELEAAVYMVLEQWCDTSLKHGVLPVLAFAVDPNKPRDTMRALVTPGFDRKVLETIVRDLRHCLDTDKVFDAATRERLE